jgi:hypothetical protein
MGLDQFLEAVDKDDKVIDDACWYNVNCIHGWIVKTCKDGIDDHTSQVVSKALVETLLASVNEVIAVKAHHLTNTLLPPFVDADGFYIGNIKIDDYYYENLVDVQKDLEMLLALPNVDHFVYHCHFGM